MDVLKFKRGTSRHLPEQLEIGEPAYCYDTGELYIGDEVGLPQLIGIPKIEIDGGFFNASDGTGEEILIMDGGDF